MYGERNCKKTQERKKREKEEERTLFQLNNTKKAEAALVYIKNCLFPLQHAALLHPSVYWNWIHTIQIGYLGHALVWLVMLVVGLGTTFPFILIPTSHSLLWWCFPSFHAGLLIMKKNFSIYYLAGTDPCVWINRMDVCLSPLLCVLWYVRSYVLVPCSSLSSYSVTILITTKETQRKTSFYTGIEKRERGKWRRLASDPKWTQKRTFYVCIIGGDHIIMITWMAHGIGSRNRSTLSSYHHRDGSKEKNETSHAWP